jgi:hypothetical protein
MNQQIFVAFQMKQWGWSSLKIPDETKGFWRQMSNPIYELATTRYKYVAYNPSSGLGF